MYDYPAHPVRHVRYRYTTSAAASPAASPSPDEGYKHYASHQKTPPVSPSSRHPSHRHSRTESFSSPRVPGGWHSPAGYSAPAYYTHPVPGPSAMPQERQPYVSNIDRLREKTRRPTAFGHGGGGDRHDRHQRHASMQLPTPRIIVDTSDEADDSAFYTHIKPRASNSKKKYGDADPYFSYPQVYDDSSDSQPQRSRARRSSYSAKSRPSPPASNPKAAPPSTRVAATPADAADAKIPAGYSIKYWDPNETPVLLLGSVFDASSLGKWIYDWTVYHHGAGTPLADMAGELWVLLIRLAGRMKRADECYPRIRGRDDQLLMEDFMDSGDRLWDKFKKILKACEGFMLKSAKKSGSKKGSVAMGKDSGCQFVDSIFGRDRQLEKTEDLMQGMRLWTYRFDVNCDHILRRPGAA